MDYLVPLQGEVPPESLRPIKEITLLDPSCGTMHFGLVAFDLFHAMYQEELDRAGEPGWPAEPSVDDETEIPEAIIAHNIYGIDIDLRAVQLSALALYLKAKTLNPKATITDSNLVCADVTPLNGARLGTFLREARFSQPIYERLMRALWARLQDVDQLGSLLRLERELGELTARERARYEREPLFAGLAGEYEREAAEDEYWGILSAQIIQGLDHFVREQAEAGADLTFFADEAVKGLRLAELMLRKYDVVVTNPPYSSRGNLNQALVDYLDSDYKDAKGDLYAAFIQRCGEWVAEDGGRVGMITQQSFMFIPTFEKLRALLRQGFAIETMPHTGPHTFAEIKGEKVNNTVFCLRADVDVGRRENCVGTYFRLVHAPEGDGKRRAFEESLATGSNMYHFAQNRFDAIPTAPWIYALSDDFRKRFDTGPYFNSLGQVKLGVSSVDMQRFYRFVWEVPINERWHILEKGGAFVKWYGIHVWAVNWARDGLEFKEEIIARYPYLNGNYGLKVRAENWLKRSGLTYTRKGGKRFSARVLLEGHIVEDNGPGIYLNRIPEMTGLAIFNSSVVNFLLNLISPGIDYQKGELERLLFPEMPVHGRLAEYATQCCYIAKAREATTETSNDFACPPRWQSGIVDLAATTERLADFEDKINNDVYSLYEVSDEDRVAIEFELSSGSLAEIDEGAANTEAAGEAKEAPITCEELAVRWISYAMGVVLGRFQLGMPRALGSALYHLLDFAIGSLPAPEKDEFNELVGPPERFAYIDRTGGRHVFPNDVELALREIALPDGIAVFDEGHPRDLPALVEKALHLMLDWYQDGQVADPAAEVIDKGASGDLRKFLERNLFAKWHVAKSWYSRRPVYWPLQSAKRSYGFVLFHEKIDKNTLYTLQRDYLDIKLNGLQFQITDLRGQLEGKSGAQRRKLERDIDKAAQVLDEVSEFAKTMERIVREGYKPEFNWIDDGVILRMAPLWELIPIWKNEPKKYWEQLRQGNYDWSHIAMNYWPGRVREACRANKSFAIAHGHEEWYESA